MIDDLRQTLSSRRRHLELIQVAFCTCRKLGLRIEFGWPSFAASVDLHSFPRGREIEECTPLNHRAIQQACLIRFFEILMFQPPHGSLPPFITDQPSLWRRCRSLNLALPSGHELQLPALLETAPRLAALLGRIPNMWSALNELVFIESSPEPNHRVWAR